ncbi:hypothetical protein MMF93_29725 [Streptomyces tubbatahanensis]|uniref:Lipopolysaccharide biosynthesis protein n=1 Tax=Streptomyces tubbatahanensis TaxID=2923272 RepID=A0ABY3Y036_9ACTN|nr:hypothetical protein [Streptomyces tubbatahanensis]UNT00172.1 hypothetical protein MMF93_29725 [Streptomyces tubbatahanensis]
MSTTAPGQPAGDAAPPRAGLPARPRVADRNGARPSRRVPGWWPLPVCAVLGALAGATYAAVAEPRYEASSYVLVSPGEHAEATSALGYAQAYGKIATDAVVLTRAEAAFELPRGELRSHVRAGTSPDAPMVEITGSAPSAGDAADYADATAAALARTAKKAAGKTGVRLTVVSHATATAEPVSPRAPLAVAVGASAGGLLGGLVLLARPRRRDAEGPALVPAPARGADAVEGQDARVSDGHETARTASASETARVTPGTAGSPEAAPGATGAGDAEGRHTTRATPHAAEKTEAER